MIVRLYGIAFCMSILFFDTDCFREYSRFMSAAGWKAACSGSPYLCVHDSVFQISSGTEFYSSVELITRDGVSFLKKEYGPMHSLYPAFVFLCWHCVFGCWQSPFSDKRESLIK